MSDFQLVFEKSVAGRAAFRLPESECASQAGASIPTGLIREIPPQLPELSEVDVVRHYTGLSRRNHGVDSGFYPLGSCTMKYNPKLNEDLAQIPGFLNSHPLSPEPSAQGSLAVLHHLERFLAEITGMDRFTLQPAAGAHGELTAMLIIKAYHRWRGESNRTKVLVPTSAHGTNPASAAMAGFEIVSVQCDARGLVDIDHLKSLLSPDIAALMLTNPNTLGLFEREIETIAALVHQAGGLLYYDGANLNAILGLIRPGDMGFDLVHLNLHKTFSTPHGGGGPGSGPVGVKSGLTQFLPYPVLEKDASSYHWDHDRPDSIGKVIGFHGNFLVLVRALAYIFSLGPQGLSQVSRDAVLNANYLKSLLTEGYPIPYNQFCMHEFVMSAKNMPNHVRAMDIAKRLIDFGFHPPTVYFPLIVEEALMIEPTETESKETLDQFAAVMLQIRNDATTNPGLITEAPHQAVISRVDEARAARTPRLRWIP